MSRMPEIEPISPATHDNNNSKMVFSNNNKKNALFGKYEVGRLLGCGAFAKVYHARNVVTGQSVAVKVIPKKKLTGTTLMSNIKREITIMRRLRHPNIVRLHEVLATRSKIYVVMELVKGGELFAKVAKGRFSEDLARKHFRQLVSAVAFCHARGVYHRDLKPENLLVDESGDLKVSDFGLSAVRDQVRADGLLHTLCGTPAYVAPDILTKKGYDGAKVDVWSCGIILFVLTAGHLPFNDPNLMNMYKKIYKGEFRCPKWMSLDLKKLLCRLLDTNPGTRITIDEITRDPWFRRGGGFKDLSFLPDYEFSDFDVEEEDENCDGDVMSKSSNGGDGASCSYSLNAFDLISFSAGLDLSGLVDGTRSPMEDVDRFLSESSAEMVVANIEALAMAESLRVSMGKKKKERLGVEIVGLNGNFVAKVEIGQLTQELVVVQVMRMAGDASLFNDLWKKKIRLQLEGLVYRGDQQHHIIPPTPTPTPPNNDDDDDEDDDV